MPTMPHHDLDHGTTFTLPTADDVEPGSHHLAGCFVNDDSGEAIFVPPQSFLSQPPLWRIDVLQDLMHVFELVRRHAIVEWAQSFAEQHPGVDEGKHLEAFRAMCDRLGIHAPENLEALLVLSARLKAAR